MSLGKSLTIIAVIIVLAAIALPNFIKPRMHYSEPACINPKTEVGLHCARSAGFPACGFWRLSSRQFRNTGLESPVNPQTGMSALQQLAPVEAEYVAPTELEISRG